MKGLSFQHVQLHCQWHYGSHRGRNDNSNDRCHNDSHHIDNDERHHSPSCSRLQSHSVSRDRSASCSHSQSHERSPSINQHHVEFSNKVDAFNVKGEDERKMPEKLAYCKAPHNSYEHKNADKAYSYECKSAGKASSKTSSKVIEPARKVVNSRNDIDDPEAMLE